MKLLTLEEIEWLDNQLVSNEAVKMEVTADMARRLLATARAYWELKHQVSISSKEGMRKKLFNDSVLPLYEKPARLPELADDKPHAPTIRAIVEALNIIGCNTGDKDLHDGLREAIKSLEKHLE